MTEALPQRTHTLSCGDCPEGCLLVALKNRADAYRAVATEFGHQINVAERLRRSGRLPETAVGDDVIRTFMANIALAGGAREAHSRLAQSPRLCRLTSPGTCQTTAQISTVPGRTGVFWASRPNRRRPNR